MKKPYNLQKNIKIWLLNKKNTLIHDNTLIKRDKNGEQTENTLHFFFLCHLHFTAKKLATKKSSKSRALLNYSDNF